MERKVIQLAGRTLVVSLPSKWARKYHVKKGDTIQVEDQDNALIISSEKRETNKKVTIDVGGMVSIIKRSLGALYKIGYDEFEVIYSSKEEFSVCQEVVREEFLGFEIVHHGKNRIVVKNVTSVNFEDFDVMFKRIFFIIKEMGQSLVESWQESDYDWIKSIVLRDKDINKIDDFCRRVLNQRGHPKYKLTAPLYYIVEQLERVGDVYRDMAKEINMGKIKASNDHLELLKRINAYFNDFFEFYYSFNLKKAHDFVNEGKVLKTLISASQSTNIKKYGGLLILYSSLVEHIFDMNGATMAINL